MPSLYVITVDGQISSFPILKQKITIGRSRNNDLILHDHTVSRHHAEILETKKGYFIGDLGSYNKTTVNGKSIESVFLKHGDKIQLGLTKLSFLESTATPDKAGESLIISAEDLDEKEVQHILQSSSVLEDPGKSRELLVSLEGKAESGIDKTEDISAKKTGDESESNLSTLARSNKVLFVLYEISRNLNLIHDFDELLKKIVDLIFMVIDADYGFLVLTSGMEGEKLIPVVVKHKTDSGAPPGEIRASRTLINKVIHDKVALLTSNAMADSRLDMAKSVMIQKIKSAICVPLWRKDKIIGVIQLDSVQFHNQFTQDDLELLKAIGSQVSMVIEQATLNEQIREEERMRNRLERFHSPQVIEMILKGGQEAKDDVMEPKELTATILFTDIVGFTHLSETMPPRETNILLNRYFSKMTDVIFKYDGTLDKYLGDGMMAVFGAPMEKEDDAERAVHAGLEIIRQLADMMKETSKDRKFDIRIGINTGRVVAGNIGSPKRMEYTVIGDPVNVASRLETIARPNQILIGEETFKLIKGKFEIQKVGAKKVKGKSAEIMVYEVTS
ncbi:MAG: FHA domain-containing protein [Deltaproteobacteria bacterium]|nr:FHA domain-containing protein [Deltaproteobacteria bacterium]